MAIWSRFFGNAASSAAGFGIGAAVSPALRPITQEVANETWQRYPNRPLSPDDAAEAIVRGLLDEDEAANEASMSGVNGERFGVIHGLAGQPPGAQELLELWNRGAIGQDDVDRGLKQSRLRPEWVGPVKALRTVLVPVSDRIRMAVREVFSPDLRRSLDLDADFPEALLPFTRQLGLLDSDARDYWAGHWDLPSRTEGADMWHRGEITEAQYDALLRALDYAPVWRGPLKAISNAIPSLSDMQRLARREVYNPAQRRALDLDADFPAEFAQQAAKHGFSEKDAKDFWAGGWRLPSATQGYHMLWRDEITEPQLDDLLKALDYAPVWRPKLANIARLVPGRVDLRRMLAAGVIDRAKVKKGYQRLGYTDADAETLTVFAEQQAASGPTVHQKWADKAKSSLFTVTHSEYLDDSLDRAGAESAFDVVGVPEGERAAIFAAWDKENEIARLELTTAQIVKAYKNAKLTLDEAKGRLADKGIAPGDADILLAV